MKIASIKRSHEKNLVVIEYTNGNKGGIFSSIGFGAELSTPELVKLFEDDSYDTNGFNCAGYTATTERLAADVTDFTTEYTA